MRCRSPSKDAPLETSSSAAVRRVGLNPLLPLHEGFFHFREESFKFLWKFACFFPIFRLVQTYPLSGPAARLILSVPLSHGEAFLALSSSIKEREGSLLLVDRREGQGGRRQVGSTAHSLSWRN